MMWILGPGERPLQLILRSHIYDLSARKWGVHDLTWIVSGGGSNNSRGSEPWRNICKAWGKLKPMLTSQTPRNLMEWQALPLWRPHCNHRNQKLALCSTKAQQMLRTEGLNIMSGVLSPHGGFTHGQIFHPESLPQGRLVHTQS